MPLNIRGHYYYINSKKLLHLSKPVSRFQFATLVS